ncbi:hypothetical protein T4B_5798 [Trichinella pseudospiralis]|uniref:Uncharacterized protein n=1 Tax=Trichinella pseudospiralis TaxID=6337 RepID=A0A0V1IFE9_TRIPS|nr:hypothetical protein T4A_1062 [Trichinella pseudospiralis]KRZ21344.1 hypothetical protein T4B_5798 [Trichinella pseudospiralis]KRZ27450.1 hypothetical protein T4C_8803 [Trichinella pseudospiralis]
MQIIKNRQISNKQQQQQKLHTVHKCIHCIEIQTSLLSVHVHEGDFSVKENFRRQRCRLRREHCQHLPLHRHLAHPYETGNVGVQDVVLGSFAKADRQNVVEKLVGRSDWHNFQAGVLSFHAQRHARVGQHWGSNFENQHVSKAHLESVRIIRLLSGAVKVFVNSSPSRGDAHLTTSLFNAAGFRLVNYFDGCGQISPHLVVQSFVIQHYHHVNLEQINLMKNKQTNKQTNK